MNHVEQTIADLRERAQRLASIADQLVVFLNPSLLPASPAVAPAPVPAPAKRHHRRRAPAAKVPARKRALTAAPKEPARESSPLLPGQVPHSIGTAMKLEILQLKPGFTSMQFIDVIREKYPELVDENPGSKVCFNLNYWANTGRLTKKGEGRDATFSVSTPDWFKQLQAS